MTLLLGSHPEVLRASSWLRTQESLLAVLMGVPDGDLTRVGHVQANTCPTVLPLRPPKIYYLVVAFRERFRHYGDNERSGPTGQLSPELGVCHIVTQTSR